jgi:RimJ/RimL family protein N-acetyltransferase
VPISEVSGVAWLALERYDDLETGVQFPLEPHQAWLYGVWIDPRQRQQGWYRHLLNTLAADIQRRGVTHLRFGIDRTNQRSHRVHERLGARRVGFCRGAKLGGWGKFTVRWL